MSLWGRGTKREEAPVDPALDRELQKRQRQWEKLERAIEGNGLFSMCTFDGLLWIDPFSGDKIPAPFDWRTTAFEHFRYNEHWRRSKTKNLAELRYVQWSHHLNEHFWNDDRFRLFAKDGSWLNPWSKRLTPAIRRSGKVIPQQVIQDMAKALALDGESNPGSLAPMAKLLEAHPDLDPQAEEPDSEVRIDSGDFSLNSVTRTETAQHSGDTNAYDFQEAPPVGTGPITTDRPTTSARSGAPRTDHISESTDSPRPGQPHQHDSSTVHHPASAPVHSGTADLGLIDTLAADEGLDTDSDLPPSNVVAHDESPDLEMARKVQQQLLGNIPDIPQLKVALHYEPFHFIGGDFYDFIQLKDRRWFVMLGDVSGHGVQAALVVSSIIKTLRFICQYSQEPDLVEILCTLNDSVRDDMVRGQFATCFAAIVDTRDTVTVECCCCGHHESVITNAYGPVFMRALGSKGMAIGIAKGDLMRRALVPESTELQPGDTLWVYTDGVCEAMNADNEEFEHWRSRAACIAHVDFPLDVQVQNLIGYVLEFTGGVRQDDLSAMALRVPHPDDLTEEEAAALEIDDAEDAV